MRGLWTWIALMLGGVAFGQSSDGMPTASFLLSQDTVCAGFCVSLVDVSTSPSGPILSWAWDAEGTSIAQDHLQDPGLICFDTPGEYAITLTVTNAQGSSQTTLNVVVTEGGGDYIDLQSEFHVCEGEEIEISANSSQSSILWSTGETGQSITVSPIGDGPIWATIDTECGSISDTAYVYLHPVPTVDTPDEIGITLGESVELPADYSGTGTITWGPDDNIDCPRCPNPQFMPSGPGQLEVTITSPWGCSTTAVIEIVVEDEWEVTASNIFSPNGDGWNDLFKVDGPPLTEMVMRIFNRWGEEMFSTHEVGVGWDGTHRSQPVPSGVYVYMIQAKTIDGRNVVKSGNITLVR